MNCRQVASSILLLALHQAEAASSAEPVSQAPNTWVKRSPVEGGPTSPGMGYEASLAYDPVGRRVIRWGGHNQGGGGEQNGETWAYDPTTARWDLREPDAAPPGACCNQQNVFDMAGGRFLRFPAFSGNHGWQWSREIDLNNSPVWGYDPARNSWRDLRPFPAPQPAPLRCASWDSDYQVAVVFGGEGSQDGTLVYDPFTNTWTRMRPDIEPEPRSGGNMAYDAARKLHILFGSQFGNDPHTWAYDLRTNRWRDMKPSLQPPTDRNDAVLAYDEANQVIVAVVRAVDQSKGDEVEAGHLETWSYDAGRNAWSRMEPPREPDGWQNRRRILVAVPDQNVILMENFTSPADRVPSARREQQVWTYRYANPRPDPTPPPPTGVRVITTGDGATVHWRPGSATGVKGYLIERGEGDLPWRSEPREVGRVEPERSSFQDRGLERGKIYYYTVRTVSGDGTAGRSSLTAPTRPRIVADVVVSVVSGREVRLAWTPPAGTDVVGYHVERAVADVLSEDQILRQKKEATPMAEPSVAAVRSVGPFTRLTRQPVASTAFTDDTIDLTGPRPIAGEAQAVRKFRADQLDPEGKPYRFAVSVYRVRAVNALGVEGGNSPIAPTVPSAPRLVFSREDGASCRLKWSANPESGLRGYRVYRMDGPRSNGPGQRVIRLTPDPIADTLHTDPHAGGQTRRYWIVAVDALGQEGYPSAPTWFEREYRRSYEPFVGEWHQ